MSNRDFLIYSGIILLVVTCLVVILSLFLPRRCWDCASYHRNAGRCGQDGREWHRNWTCNMWQSRFWSGVRELGRLARECFLLFFQWRRR